MKSETIQLEEPIRIYDLTISQNQRGCYEINFRHTGSFRLKNYAAVKIKVLSAELIKKSSQI
jgi:hypothetical protein